MFGIFKLKGFNPDAFEKELTLLTKQISGTQQQIYQLKARSKRTVYSLCKILIIVYVLVEGYIYQNTPRSPLSRNRIANYLRSQSGNQLLILAGYPVVSYFAVYLINRVFKFLIEKQERYLKTLKQKHLKKIEELKKITNFNTTNELLNKYDTHEDKNKGKGTTLGSKTKQRPKAGPQSQSVQGLPQNSQQQQQIIERLQKLQANPPAPKPRTIQDRMLDFIIGSDNNEAIEKRFALICKQCLTHNGLAPPGCDNPFKVAYVCPNCGLLNGDMDQADALNEMAAAGTLSPMQIDSRSRTPVDDALSIDGRDLMDSPVAEAAAPEIIDLSLGEVGDAPATSTAFRQAPNQEATNVRHQ